MAAASNLEHYLAEVLTELKRIPGETLLARRYEKLRHAGDFFVPAAKPVKKKVTVKNPVVKVLPLGSPKPSSPKTVRV
jgi:hypothetical protein